MYTFEKGGEQTGGQKQPHSEGRVGLFRVMGSPSLVSPLLIDELIDSFRLHNFSPVQPLTHKHPSGNGLRGCWAGNGNTNLL